MKHLPQKVSLVSQTVAVIEQEIAERRWEQWLPGEHELSRQLHVSRRTVRAALVQLDRRGVVKCRWGKRRQIVHRSKQRGKSASERVVVLMPMPLQATNPFSIFLIDRLREHLAEAGYLLEIHASRVPYRARLPQELKNLEDTLRPAGWVLLQSTQAMQRWFAARQRPCVVVGSCYEGIRLPSVDTDYRAVCHHAVGRLLARGYRRLVLLNPKPEAAGDAKTEDGFVQAIRHLQLADVSGETLYHDGSVGNICTRLGQILDRKAPPPGLLVSRPRHVLTVMGFLLRRGIRFTQDAALISRDDDSFLEDMIPSVARYSRNPAVFASKVSRLVLEIVQGTSAFADHTIMPRFIKGETLG